MEEDGSIASEIINDDEFTPGKECYKYSKTVPQKISTDPTPVQITRSIVSQPTSAAADEKKSFQACQEKQVLTILMLRW